MPSRVVAKPWGHERIWAETPRYVGKILHMRAGEARSLQYHQTKDETILVLAGRIQLTYFAEDVAPATKELAPGEPFHIPPGLRHRMTAIEDAEILEVSTPEQDDIVRLDDRYGRAGTTAP